MRTTHFTQKGFTPHTAGFTLLETIVAVSILMAGILGPMLLAKQNLKASRDASDRLIASYLAQEGIESVRSVIANNSADTSTATLWLTNVVGGVASCENTTNRCIFDVTVGVSGQPLLACPAASCSRQLYQDASGVYRQTNSSLAAWGTPTRFSRDIQVTVRENNKRITASTTVWWPRGNITLQEDVYNWFFQLN